jgi:hypothetical protein
LNLESYETVVERLQQGDNITFSYWRYGLARKGAEYLGEWDGDIKAVYIFDYEATPEDVCFAEVTPDIMIHLIVWAQRKTAALNSLIGTCWMYKWWTIAMWRIVSASERCFPHFIIARSRSGNGRQRFNGPF